MPLSAPIYLDTNAIIAIIELNGVLSSGQIGLVRSVEAGEFAAVTSELSLTECLVKPIADKNAKLVKAFLELLSGDDVFHVASVSRQVLIEAARVRAEKSVKLADAIHLATAQTRDCKTFVSNDRRLLSAWPREAKYWSEL